MKVIKFGAIWCNGCIVMKPRWKEIEEENLWLKSEYFDFDNDKEMVEKYNIDSNLPVFVFIDKQGHEFLRLQGEVDKNKIVEIINDSKDK